MNSNELEKHEEKCKLIRLAYEELKKIQNTQLILMN